MKRMEKTKMADAFEKKFANGDILALADDYVGIDKDKMGLVRVYEANKYVMLYVLTGMDGKGRYPVENVLVDKHYEKIGEYSPGSSDELLFSGHVTFEEDA